MQKKEKLFIVLSILIIFGGIFVRFWQLDSIPPGIQYDEAYNGINALDAIKTGDYKVFYPENYGREGFHINIETLFIRFFGPSGLTLRLANAIWGSLTLIGFYFLLKQLKFSGISVLLGTFMLSFSFWHLVFSRTAYRAIMVPLLLVWIFHFLFKALESKGWHKRCYLLLSGLLFGLGFHTYIAFRIAPLAIAVVALSLILTRKKIIKNNWKEILIFTAVALLIALPILIYFSGHIKDLLFRSEAVSIFDSPKMSPGAAFWKSLTTHINAFFVSGDHNPRHNYNSQPLLPAAWSVLFALGFFISASEIMTTIINFIKKRTGEFKKTGYSVTRWFYASVLAQSIFWVMLVPGILSIEGIPHSLRIIGTIPAVFIFCVLAIEYIFNLYEHIRETAEPGYNKTSPSQNLKNRNNPIFCYGKEISRFMVLPAGIIILIIYSGYAQFHTYFRVWADDLATYGAYERKLYDLGDLIKNLSPHKNNYLVTAYNTWISFDGRQSSLKTTEYTGYPNSQKYIFYRPMEGFKYVSCEDPLIIFQESDQWLRDQYKNRCPDLIQQRFSYDDGKYMFWVMMSK
jgi:4-amino-4-deoxy-L-arabinose transferase-like glycosyltransferase